MKPRLLLLVSLAAGFLPGSLAAEPVLTLRESFQRALVRSESLAVQEENIRIAEAHVMQARGLVLPHVSVNASELIQDTSTESAAAGDGSVGNTFTRRSRPEVAITLNQPIFHGFRGLNALKIAGAEKKRNTLDWERARQLLFADVARTYYTVLEIERELGIHQSIRSTLVKRTGELQGRIDLGKSRASELLITESELASNEADIERTRGAVLAARDALGFFIGEEATAPLKDEFPTPSKTPALASYVDVRENRPDYGATQEEVRLAKGRVAFEKGDLFPRVEMEANYYPYRVGFLSDIDWDLNFTLNFPIFRGGLTRGRIREAKAELKQSELTRDETSRRAELEIRQSYHTFIAARTEESALRNAENKAGANYQAQISEYDLGLVNNLDVLTSLRDWQNKRLDTNRAYFRTKLRYLELLVAAGELPPREGLD